MSSNLSVKRISKEIKEIYENPIEGIGIISLDNDIKKYLVNIKLLTGPYKNYCLQLLLTFPDNYPIKPPKILIYPNQLFDNLYHHHVFNDENTLDENGKCFKKLCIDLLDNDFMSTKDENTGWNPSYTISTFLMQIQIFLSDPDLSENSMPKPYQIEQLFESMNNYERIFTINDGKNEIIKIHTWKDPYPKIYFKENKEINTADKYKDLNSIDKNEIIKENLTCFITKLNIFDDPNIIFGYPIVKESSKIIYPISEILSYEGYLTQISNEETNKFSKSLKSANNKYYDNWLPIYINKDNFEKNKQTILNSFSVIKFGLSGEKYCDFKPEYISEIMFKLIYKMICDIKDKNFSSSYIRAFFQYIFLYKKLLEFYPIKLDQYFDYDFILRNDISFIIGDLMVASLFDKIDSFENNLLILKESLKNNLAYQFFLEKKDCEFIAANDFIEYLEKNNLFYKIFEVMKFEKNFFLYNGKKLKNKAKKIILTKFKQFILHSDENTKKGLKKVILNNTKFYNYIDLNKFLNNELKIDTSDTDKKIKNINDNFLLYLHLKKIIEEKNFINKLENNFGVYIEIDEIITKLNEIIKILEKFNNKEIEIEDKKIFDNITNNIIKELFLLDNNSSKCLENEEFFKFLNSDSFVFPFNFGHYFINGYGIEFLKRNRERDISFYKKIEKPFGQIEKLKLDDLRLIHLFCSARLNKSINPEDNYLSIIERMYFECSINKNRNNNCKEWYNYLSEKQNYNYINGNKDEIDNNKLSQKMTKDLFQIAIKLNEKLFSRTDIKNIKLYLEENKIYISKFFENIENIYEFIKNAIIITIIKFAFILNRQTQKFEDLDFYRELMESHIIFNLTKNDYLLNNNKSLISKLKEIYESGDITLLTFYEFIWLEDNYNICNGFLSSLKNVALYNFKMRKHILKIKEELKPRMNNKYKKEKKIYKKSDNKFYKMKKRNQIYFVPKKSRISNRRIYIKLKKKNNFR